MRLNRDNGAGQKIGRMFGESAFACCRLPACGDIHETNDTEMRHAANYGQFAEILVERDEGAIFPECALENFGVARVLRPIASPDDIVSQLLKLSAGAASHAGV
jgi:hypothetical protein